jgi:hypothetical protein
MQEEFLKFMVNSNRFPIRPLSAAFASGIALPPRSEELTGRDRIGGGRLWRTTSPWCFDKGYVVAQIVGLGYGSMAHDID